MRLRRQGLEQRLNPVALLAAVVGVVSLVNLGPWQPGWLLFKANRLVQGEAATLWALSPAWAYLFLGLWLGGLLAAFVPGRIRPWLLGLLTSLLLVLLVLALERGTAELLAGAAASARVSLMGGVWLTLLALYILLFAALHEAPRGLWRRGLLVAPGLVAAAVLIATGTLAELGLARELLAQGGDFWAEVLRHLALAGTSVFLAALIGVPAAIWSARREQVARVVLPTASLLQTLPSLALFGLMLAPLARLGREVSLGEAALVVALGVLPPLLLLLGLQRYGMRFSDRWRTGLAILAVLLALLPASLLTVVVAVSLNQALVALFSGGEVFAGWSGWDAPLSSLGVRGIGTAPALIALTLYALLPVVRNTYTGIREVPAAVIEAGRGMGMAPGQILRRLELPLALPLIVEGLRASAVLTIGITTVAYLIGAGGLGVFIQRGIDQVVPDLILVGAVPIIVLALLADGLLRALGLLLTPRGLRA